ncbi:MAG: hypothetical protein DCC71_17675 [Proteobacteria bacterium]|nr:MAG: hypothetical protein DCC71_17675 [Pseudomonadota bacterium]
MEGRRRVLWFLLGGVSLCLAGLYWFDSAPAASGASAQPASAAVAAPPPAAPAVATSQRRRPVADTPLAELPAPIRRFLEATPYPPTSGRLAPHDTDLLRPNRRHERHRPIPDTLSDDPRRTVTWLFSADRWAYVGPETVHAWLEVKRGGEPLEVNLVSATATREGAGGAEGAPEPVDFHRNGDRLVADVALARFADHFGPIVLAVRFEYEPGRFHDDQLRIQSTPAGHVPGRVAGASDRVENGSLVLDVAAELSVGGFYRFDANVYGPSGDPVAFATFKGELPAGAQSVPLEVWGKVLRDAGVPGPYTIGEVRGYRFLDGQYPDRELLPEVPARFETKPWPLDAFRDEQHVSPHELQMAELMLDDLEQGRPLFEPPPAQDAVAPRLADDDAESPAAD